MDYLNFHGMYISSDKGATWDTVTVDSSDIYSTLNDIFIDKNGDILLATANGVYRYDDSENIVRRLGLAHHKVLCITQHSNGMLMVGTWYSGIHVSFDEGKTWYLLSYELRGKDFIIYTLAFDSAGYLYAGLYGRGVFRSKRPANLLSGH